MTALVGVVCTLVGAGAGFLVQRLAARFVPATALGPAGAGVGGRSGGGDADGGEVDRTRSISVPVPPALPVAATAVLCGLAALRFGPTWQLPAFLLLAVVGVRLAVIDLEHRLLPNRVLLPGTVGGTALLTVAAATGHDWTRLRTAVLGAVILFVSFLGLALLAPSGLGLGDVKLAALLGLYLGWLGGRAIVVGVVAGFVVQAALAVALLAGRVVSPKSEIPFGPALLVGAFVAVGYRW